MVGSGIEQEVAMGVRLGEHRVLVGYGQQWGTIDRDKPTGQFEHQSDHPHPPSSGFPNKLCATNYLES